MTATVAGIHLGIDTHANRPAGNAVPDGSVYSCSTHGLIYKSDFDGNSWATWATLGAAASGSITASGYTQATARLLGRTTGSTGAIEEISVGAGLSLSAGSLAATGSGGDTEFAEATRTAGDLTTTSTSFVDATGMSVTLTTAAVRCRVIVIANVTNNSASSTCVDIAVDGTLQGQANGLAFAVGTNPTSACFEYITAVLSAASHTIKIQWRVTGGTGTLYASTGVAPLKLQVIETNLAT